MTDKLGSFTFDDLPEYKFGMKARLAPRKKYGGKTTHKGTGYEAMAIVLVGMLEGSGAQTDRDSLLTILKSGSKQDFCAESIGYGTPASPKKVWVDGMEFTHPVGVVDQIPYTITLVEDE